MGMIIHTQNAPKCPKQNPDRRFDYGLTLYVIATYSDRVSKYGDNHAHLECPIVPKKSPARRFEFSVMEAFQVTPKNVFFRRHSKCAGKENKHGGILSFSPALYSRFIQFISFATESKLQPQTLRWGKSGCSIVRIYLHLLTMQDEQSSESATSSRFGIVQHVRDSEYQTLLVESDVQW